MGVYFENFLRNEKLCMRNEKLCEDCTHKVAMLGTWVWFSINFAKINSAITAILKFVKYTPLEITRYTVCKTFPEIIDKDKKLS